MISRTKTIVAQRLVMFIHKERNLFYIQVTNDDANFAKNSSLSRQVGRARHRYQNVDNLKLTWNGFLVALINTNFEGWTRHDVDYSYPDQTSAARAKDELIDKTVNELNLKYAGVTRFMVKGVVGEGDGSGSWNNKFPKSMTKKKIDEKLSIIESSLPEPISKKIRNAVYMMLAGVDGYDPATLGFGNYEVYNLGTLLYYVHDHLKVVEQKMAA